MSKYKKNEDILSIMWNLQPNCCLKVDFQKLDQHAGGKWLIHDTKRSKDNQLQSLKLPWDEIYGSLNFNGVSETSLHHMAPG